MEKVLKVILYSFLIQKEYKDTINHKILCSIYNTMLKKKDIMPRKKNTMMKINKKQMINKNRQSD